MKLRLVPFAVAMTLLAVPFAASFARGRPVDEGKPACSPNTVFENSEVRIWFQENKEQIHIYDLNTSTGGQGKYTFVPWDLEERSASGAALETMKLNRAFPSTSDCTIVETDQFINMSLKLTGTVRTVNGGPVGSATVTFDYHFNKTALGAKFDFIADSWPWGSTTTNDTLSLVFDVKADGDLSLQKADNGIGIRDSNGTSQGYVDWAQNATARYADGHNETANVTASYDPDTANASAYRVSLTYGNVTPGYTELEMDPWMGIGDYIIVANHLIGLAPIEQLLPTPIGRAVRNLL